jgi:PAS domain S-box-containing protein
VAKKQVLETASSFKLLFESSPVAIGISRLSDGCYVEINEAFLKLHEYTRNEVIGHSSTELGLWNKPEERAAVVAHIENGDQSFNFSHEYRTRSGKTGHALVSAKRIDLEGTPCLIGFITDINELDETQRALVERVRDQQAIFEHMHNGVAHCRVFFEAGHPADVLFLSVNKAFEQLTGLKSVVGKRTSEVIPEIRLLDPSLFEAMGRVASTRRPEKLEHYVASLKKWYSISAFSPQHGEFVVIFEEITEHKRTESALASSEAEFRLLAEAMPQIVWITRADGWNIYFNRQWVEYTGLSMEESYGHGWNKPFHPDDRQCAWDAWKAAVQNKCSYALESRLRRADGEYRWWLVRGVPVYAENGDVEKWFGTCTDIHDLKLSEAEIQAGKAKLEAALASMSDAVFISDTEGCILDSNDAAVAFHRFHSREDCPRVLAGFYEYLEAFSLEGTPIPLDQWAVPRALRGETASNVEVSMRRRDTGETWIGSYSFAPMRNARGEIFGAVVTGRDVTKEKEATQALQQESAKNIARECEEHRDPAQCQRWHPHPG